MINKVTENKLEQTFLAVRNLISTKEHFAYVLTLGCQQNEADSEKISGMLTQMGYTLTEEPEKADFIAINTCAIREHAELKAFSTVGRFKILKQQNPELIIAVCGCMAAEPKVIEKIKKSFYYVSFTLEPSQLYRFPELVLNTLLNRKRAFLFGSENPVIQEGLPTVRKSQFKAWVSIMYGCNNFCSYCIVPYVRGRERSRNSEDIIKECNELVKAGYREITLLGQNVNSYSSDINFASLLEKVANIDGDFIIRFMTSHPKDVSDELIEVVTRYSGKIAPSFHLPLQSGNDRVLRDMNRHYNMEKYLSTVKKLREKNPTIALTSDIIVGYPGETEDEFADTLTALEKIKFDMVFSFIYSLREGTLAAKMPGHLPYEIKSERMSRLLKLQTEISKEKNLCYVGEVQRVLVDSEEFLDGILHCKGRSPSNKLVHFTSNESCTGKFKNIKIVRAGAFDLFGEEIRG